MKISSLIRLQLVFILAVFCVSVFPARAQNPLAKGMEGVSYEDMLDFVFAENFIGQGTGYGIRLRYTTPERGNEMQLTILETSDGRTEARIFVPVGESIIEQFYSYTERHPDASFDQIASQIRIKKVLLPLSTVEVRRLREEIFEVVVRSVKLERETLPHSKKSLKTTIILHSDAYKLWFYGVADFHLFGESPTGRPEPPFITWMKKKRPQFEKWAESR